MFFKYLLPVNEGLIVTKSSYRKESNSNIKTFIFMRTLNFIGTPLNRSEMRNISGGRSTVSFDMAPCPENSCTSDANCGTPCNRPGIKSYCATTVCNEGHSTYKSCSC